LFNIARNILLQLPPETAHKVTLEALSAAARLRLVPGLVSAFHSVSVEVMGLHFDNQVGLAAGLDKNGSCWTMQIRNCCLAQNHCNIVFEERLSEYV